MTRPHRLPGFVAAAAALAGPACAAAQTAPPRCDLSHRGEQACMQGDTCTCDWYRGGSITAEPSGWRWDCRIEAMCGAPAPADGGSAALPPGTVLAPQFGGAPEADAAMGRSPN